MKIKSSYILKSDKSGQFLVAVGVTGFKHGNFKTATRFDSLEDLNRFKSERGITWPATPVLVHDNVKHGIELRWRKGRKLRLLSYAIYIDGGCLVDHATTRADDKACGGIDGRLEIERKNNPTLPII